MDNIKGPMLFTQENLQKVIDGGKTQTRRIEALKVINDAPDEWEYSYKTHNNTHVFRSYLSGGAECAFIKPRHQVGDVLYLSEPTKITVIGSDEPEYIEVQYKDSTIIKHDWASLARDIQERILKSKRQGKWQQSRFMFKCFARYFVRITGVKEERLQDISKTDAIAEGIPEGHYSFDEDGSVLNEKYLFAYLWDSINGKPIQIHDGSFPAGTSCIDISWKSNPWVFAYTFEKVTA